MRSFYLSLAVLALTFDLSDAIGSSGLLRERKEEHHRQLQTKSSKSKGSKGKSSSSSSTLSPVCPGESSSSSKSKGKGGKGKSKSTTNRFLEEVRQLNGKGKGKSSSSSSDDCDCDPPTDLCEDEDPGAVTCQSMISDDTVLSTSLGCDLGTGAGQVPYGLIVDGVTLECTGDGDNMIYGEGGTSSDQPCIILRNGATLKNCHVYNCGIGVVMQGQGNNRVVGSTFFGNGVSIETGSVPTQTTLPRPTPPIDNGCYSVECTKIIGSRDIAEAAVLVRHGGNMIISNTDILGPLATGVRIWPEQPNTLAVAFDDTNFFGSAEGTTRNIGIQMGTLAMQGMVAPWGIITEVGFYGQNQLVGHLYSLLQDGRGHGSTTPPSIVVYGSIESYDTWIDSYQIMDAALMFEDGSEPLACTFGQNVAAATSTVRDLDPDGVSFDLQPMALPLFMDMGAEVTCTASASPVVCDITTCPPAPSTAFSCSGDGSSSSSKSKGKGGKGKSKSST